MGKACVGRLAALRVAPARITERTVAPGLAECRLGSIDGLAKATEGGVPEGDFSRFIGSSIGLYYARREQAQVTQELLAF